MSKRIETIKDRLNEVEQKQQEAINQSRAERAELTAKLAELEEKLKDPANLDDYKKTAQEIRDTQAYIDFLDAKKEKAKTGLLNDAEFKDMRKTLEEEIKARQTDAAAEIQEKFFVVIDLMEKYYADVFGLEEVLKRATLFNNPKAIISGRSRAAEIYDITPDKYGYWQEFCRMFFNAYPDAMRKKHEEAHPWKK